jgi:hypothetical protein
VSKISLTPFLYILYWFLKVYLPGLTIKCWNIWYISSSTFWRRCRGGTKKDWRIGIMLCLILIKEIVEKTNKNHSDGFKNC